jgi:hypothetical protein
VVLALLWKKVNEQELHWHKTRYAENKNFFTGDEDDEILKFFNTRSNYELHIKTKNYSKSYKGNEP